MKKSIKLLFILFIFPCVFVNAFTINHIQGNSAFFSSITSQQVQNAKNKLHIAYGHTSHGSQLTTGMNGLNDFINGGGLGMSRPTDFFDWNHGGTGGDLDLHDYAMGGDVGYYPQWYNNTVNYLNNSANSNCNVIIWSWCGQVSGKFASGTISNEYLLPMASLETNYPAVTFVYMTGHLDHWSDDDLKAGNQMIRDFCTANDKILYDFADIESYDPEGNYYEFANDNCDYYTAADGSLIGNWAVHYQTTHVENVDWYDCYSAHSEPLNANQKAYGAWALWTRIAVIPEPFYLSFVIYYFLFINRKFNRRMPG